MSRLTLPSIDKSPMMSRKEAAEYLYVSVHTIDRMIARGELRTRIIGKRTVRIYRTSVEKEAS
jgi:excisionase family DNA binding protein